MSNAHINAIEPKTRRRNVLSLIAAMIAAVLISVVFVLLPEDKPTLTWPAPPLDEPTTVLVTDDRALRLDPQRDYRLVLPCDGLKVEDGITISGGRNVELTGGVIELTGKKPGRALYLVNQRGTLHIDGLHITGNLGEGINLVQRQGAIVQLQNIVIDKIRGSYDGHHADLIQTWAGPAELRIDRFEGTTEYQGFFLLPNQFFDGPQPRSFDLRNVLLRSTSERGYLIWRDNDKWPFHTKNVRLDVTKGDRSTEFLVWPKPDSTDTPLPGVSVNRNASPESPPPSPPVLKSPMACP